jgi:hypothetical protein
MFGHLKQLRNALNDKGGGMFGPRHISTSNAFHTLGIRYASQGKLDEAEKMYMRALQGWKEAVEPEVIYKRELQEYEEAVARNTSTFGAVHKNEGRLDEAEKSGTSKQTPSSDIDGSEAYYLGELILSWAVARFDWPESRANKDPTATYLRYDIGDVVCVLRKDSSGWWYVCLATKRLHGWIPSTLFRDLQPKIQDWGSPGSSTG